MPLEKRAPYLSDLVHRDHPLEPFLANAGQRKGTLTKRQRGRDWTRKAPLRGSLLRASSHSDRSAIKSTPSMLRPDPLTSPHSRLTSLSTVADSTRWASPVARRSTLRSS